MSSEATIKGMLEFYAVLRQIVGRDTSADPEGYDAMNILWGQCAVAALLFQDVFGGILKNAKAQPGGISHYWNVLSDGQEVDLTRDQFKPLLPIFIDHTYQKQRGYVLLFEPTRRRYEILRKRYEEAVGLEKKNSTN